MWEQAMPTIPHQVRDDDGNNVIPEFAKANIRDREHSTDNGESAVSPKAKKRRQ
jgi:hypothetical protein